MASVHTTPPNALRHLTAELLSVLPSSDSATFPPRQPEATDPRRTETAQAATRHVAVRPTDDLALFYAIAHCLVREHALDHGFLAEHTADFEEIESPARSLPARSPVLVVVKASAVRVTRGQRTKEAW